jgi:hypothetical protein
MPGTRALYVADSLDSVAKGDQQSAEPMVHETEP